MTRHPLMCLALVALLLWCGGTALGAPFAYITNFGTFSISVIDLATNTVTVTILTGVGTLGVAVSPDGALFYVTNFYYNTVSIFNTATYAVTAVAVGIGPYGIAVSPDGARVYVTNDDGTLSVISTATNTVTATVGVGSWPRGVAVTPDGTRVYVANENSNTVSVISTATNTVTAAVGVGNNPLGVAVSPDGTHVYVTNYSGNTVSVISTATNTVTATVGVGSNPTGVAVTPDGARVYVANYNSNSVSVISTVTNTVTATVGVGSGPTAFGQFISPASTLGPSLALNLNQSAFHPGQQLLLTATVTPGATPVNADVYVALELPGGSLLFLLGDGSLSSSPQPIVGNWTIGPFNGQLFAYTFGGGEPQGSYTWMAAFAQPGTLNFLGPIVTAPFTFGP